MHLMIDCCSLYLSFYLHGPSTQPHEEHMKMGQRPFGVPHSCILEDGRLQNAIFAHLPTASIQDKQLTYIPVSQMSMQLDT